MFCNSSSARPTAIVWMASPNVDGSPPSTASFAEVVSLFEVALALPLSELELIRLNWSFVIP